MATITAVTSSVMGEYLNVLDPTTWVGGVVPGEGDTAVFPAKPFAYYRNSGDSTAPYNYNYLHPLLTPWTGSNMIKKDGAGDYITDEVKILWTTLSSIKLPNIYSGSYYVTMWPYISPDNMIKINFSGSNGSTLAYHNEIDESYRKWISKKPYQEISGSPMDHDHPDGLAPAIGSFYYNANHVIAGLNQYELTGSGEWVVDHIDMNRYTDFKIKNDAKLYLSDAGSGNAYIDIVTGYCALQIYDQSQIIVSGAYGSTEQTNSYPGIYCQNKTGFALIVSGSSNYSSSFVSESTSTGDVELKVDNPNAFGPGDIVSIQTDADINQYNFPGNTSLRTYTNAQYKGHFFTGSILDEVDPGNIPTPDDEWTKIVTQSNGVAITEKILSRHGSVDHEVGSYSYDSYVQTFKDSNVSKYSGNYKVIAVDSIHKSYARGENIIINNKSYNIKAVSKILTQSLMADFTKENIEPKDIFLSLDNMMTGSGANQYTYAGDASVYYKYSEYYNKNFQWITGSSFYNEYQDQNCFYLNSSSLKTYGPNPYNSTRYDTYLASVGFLTGASSHWFDGEIEISASVANTLLNAVDYDSAVGFGTFHPHAYRGGGDTNFTQINFPVQATKGFEYEQWGFSSKYGLGHRPIRESNYGWMMPFDSVNGSQKDQFKEGGQLKDHHDRFAGLNFPCNYTGSGGSFSIKLDRNDRYNKFSFKDNKTDYKVYHESFSDPVSDGAVSVFIEHWAKIYSISIKHRYQTLLLDTTDSFSDHDKITDAGLLYAHAQGKTIDHIGTEIADPLGYEHIGWREYYEKRGKTSFRPYMQGVTYNAASYNNGTLYTGEPNSSFRPFQKHENWFPYYFTSQWTNAASEVTFDLGAPTTFDAIGYQIMGSVYGEGSRTTTTYGSGGYPTNLRFSYTLDHSTNFSDANTASFWGDASGRPDYRTSTGVAGIRYFTGSNAVTAQVIRIQNAGHSKLGVAGCDYGNISFHLGQSGSSRHQIELKSTTNWKVGDMVYFYNPNEPGSNSSVGPSGNYVSYFLANQTANYKTLTADQLEAGSVGGFKTFYEITAIDRTTNRITLDRDPAYNRLYKGTIVLKANRGNVKFDSAHPGLNKNGCKLRLYGNNVSAYIKNAMFTAGQIYKYASNTHTAKYQHFENLFIQGGRQGMQAMYLYDTGPVLVKNVFMPGRGIGTVNRSLAEGTSKFYGIINHNYDTNYHDWDMTAPWHINFVFNYDGGTNSTFGYFATQYNSYGTQAYRGRNIKKNVIDMSAYDHSVLNYARASANYSQNAMQPNAYDKIENVFTNCYYPDIYSTSTDYPFISSAYERQHWKLQKKLRESIARTRMRDQYQRYNNWGSYGQAMGGKSYGVPRASSHYHGGKNIIIINRLQRENSTPGFCLIEYWIEPMGRNVIPNPTTEGFNTFKEAKWFTSKPSTIRIKVSMDYITTDQFLHAYDEYSEVNTTYPKKDVVSGFRYPYANVPYLALIKSNETLGGATSCIDVIHFDSTDRDFTNFVYDKTITTEENTTYKLQWGFPANYMYDHTAVAQKYKNLEFNILTETPNEIVVLSSNWDNEILFNETTDGTLNAGTNHVAAHGPEAMIRKVNDISDSSLGTVKFNKLKIK